MSVRLIDGTSEKERHRAISAMTLAFARDPLMRWLYPDADDYLLHFPNFSSRFAGAAFDNDTAWVAGDVKGAALWLPPGVHADGESIAEYMFASVEETRHEALREALSQMDDQHPTEPHWYLATLGVDGAHQGQGLGASLLAPALQRCDEEGVIGYLESSNPANIPLYERHGFEVIAEIQTGDAPPFFPMRRPAR
jgi:ribosomal protein S18 acetylase RimI-like enzyme